MSKIYNAAQAVVALSAKILSGSAAMAGLFVVSASASAQSAEGWIAKAGYNHFYPQVKSGDITGVPNGKVDVGNGGGLYGSAIYAFSENISTELAFGIPPKLDITGQGSIASVGKIADAKILAPIGLLQYRFGPANNVFRPYVGIGVTYVKFNDVTATSILSMITNPGGNTTASIDNAWGVTGQIGATYALGSRWFIDGSIVPFRVKTTARLSTGQAVDVKVNPVAVSIALGYRF